MRCQASGAATCVRDQCNPGKDSCHDVRCDGGGSRRAARLIGCGEHGLELCGRHAGRADAQFVLRLDVVGEQESTIPFDALTVSTDQSCEPSAAHFTFPAEAGDVVADVAARARERRDRPRPASARVDGLAPCESEV
jgi:hypothetical protein